MMKRPVNYRQKPERKANDWPDKWLLLRERPSTECMDLSFWQDGDNSGGNSLGTLMIGAQRYVDKINRTGSNATSRSMSYDNGR